MKGKSSSKTLMANPATWRFATILAISVFVAFFVVRASATTVGDINFEIDGNTEAGDETADADDWESVITGGGPDWDGGPGTLIQDGNAGPKSVLDEENIFAQGGKFDNPGGWTIQPGNTPAQNDLTNIYSYATTGTSGDFWVVMGMHRIKKQGTFDLDFEYNQVSWDGTSGSLVRTEGDVVVGFELSGNPEDPDDDLEVVILYYKPDDPECDDEAFFTGVVYGAGFCEVFRDAASALSGFGVATMNAVDFDEPPWGAFDTDGSALTSGEDVEAFFFAEAAINLTELGIPAGCPGFGTVHAKSRSSLEVEADLKDLAGPVDFPVACFIEGYKFHDLNADGVWQLGADGEPNTGDEGEEPSLSGWQINLSGQETDSTTTDSNGYYRFSGLSDGNYTVTEVCPAGEGWFQSYPSPNPATSCGNNTHGFSIDINNQNHRGDFGNYQNATKSGVKFKDANGNGVKDTGDAGLQNWVIKVFSDDDGSGDLSSGDGTAFTSSDTTDSSGAYSFSLTPGKYIVCEVITTQTNWMQTHPVDTNDICEFDAIDSTLAPDGYAIDLSSGDTDTNNDFGNSPQSKFDVRFFDLTGSTDATISCEDANEGSVGSITTDDESASPELVLEATAVPTGVFTCTITISDP